MSRGVDQAKRGDRHSVLVFSWEYPPVLVGGLGRHVHALATALVREGHQVTVVTRYGEHPDGSPAALDEVVDGVRVIRAPQDPPLLTLTTETLLAWTMSLNHALVRAALGAGGEYDVVHAHDWLVNHAAVTLKHHLRAPLVATIHSTEAGRHRGWLPAELNRCIHSIEWWLTYEARRVLVCSEDMRWEVSRLFELPAAKTQVVHNGVDPAAFAAAPAAVKAQRDKYSPDGPMVLYAGRLVFEKGVQDLLDAVPALRERHPGLRVVIAGDGPHAEDLKAHAVKAKALDGVDFVGFIGGHDLPALYAAADCLVVPSRYEPFGLVALEAAAAGTPVVASDVGGLAEIVESGVTGLSFPPADVGALTEAVSTVLSDQLLARRITASARAMVHERFGWSDIAAETARAYTRAVDEERALRLRQSVGSARPSMVIPEGNLLLRDA
ncbi:glycosyltransferase family 4 protein [Phytomonospora sp. NPDC050363]|uniref:glycosyltransferase family 4 protein n=1 Tax=Phytomonospora sp. NPDC050363 TaxID=3155642 RepID=UPI0033E89312